jgi:hypothetical protein
MEWEECIDLNHPALPFNGKLKVEKKELCRFLQSEESGGLLIILESGRWEEKDSAGGREMSSQMGYSVHSQRIMAELLTFTRLILPSCRNGSGFSPPMPPTLPSSQPRRPPSLPLSATAWARIPPSLTSSGFPIGLKSPSPSSSMPYGGRREARKERPFRAGGGPGSEGTRGGGPCRFKFYLTMLEGGGGGVSYTHIRAHEP